MSVKVSKERVAIHEAGHAVIGLGLGLGIYEMAVYPSDGEPDAFEGHTMTEKPSPAWPYTGDPTDLAVNISLAMAGSAAADIHAGERCDSGASADIDDAARCALHLSWSGQGRLTDPSALVGAGYRAAERAMRHPDVWRLVDKIAAALRLHGRLDAADVRRLADGHPGVAAVAGAMAAPPRAA